jgi:Core-2/I-Branching enzyme
MKLACIILAHRQPAQLAQLLAVLRHPSVNVYLHVDRRANERAFRRAFAEADTDESVFLRRRTTRWGGIELVDASVDGLARAAVDGCEYFFLLSGQDFPLRPVEYLVEFAESAGSRSYLSYWSLPSSRWRLGGRDRTDFYTYTVFGRRETCLPAGEDTSSLSWKGRLLNEGLRFWSLRQPPRRFPDYVRPFAGLQWWNLSRSAAEFILDFVRHHPDYRRYHEHTSCPDELFFHSILLGSGFAERYEVVNDSLRFMIWPRGDSHPRVLTLADLPAMQRSGALFARKLDVRIDRKIVDRLAELATR